MFDDDGELAVSAFLRQVADLPEMDARAGLPDALAAYRAQRRRRPIRRRWSHVTATVAAFTTAATVGGGLAAAYASVLPTPVQHVAHRLLAHVGVPDAHARPVHHVNLKVSPPKAAVAHRMQATGGRIVLSLPHHRVIAGRDLLVLAELSPQGVLPDTQVVSVWERPAGGHWSVTSTVRPDERGVIQLRVSRLSRNTQFRLVCPGLASQTVTVHVTPRLQLRARSGAGIQVTAIGAQAGDRALLVRLDSAKRRVVAQLRLDRNGRAMWRANPGKGQSYIVELPATNAHDAAASPVLVVA